MPFGVLKDQWPTIEGDRRCPEDLLNALRGIENKCCSGPHSKTFEPEDLLNALRGIETRINKTLINNFFTS